MSTGLDIAYKNIIKQQLNFNNLWSDLYSHIYVYEEITNQTVERVTQELAKFSNIQKKNITTETKNYEILTLPKPVIIHMHSPGGDTNAGIALSNIHNSKVPIIVIAEGVVASAATFILVKAKLSYILDSAFVLIHQYFGVLSGKQEELKFDINIGNRFMKFLIDMYVKNTKLKKKVVKDLLQHDIFLSANDCIKYGIVDRVIIKRNPVKNIFFDTRYSFQEFFLLKNLHANFPYMNVLSLIKSTEENSKDSYTKAFEFVRYIHYANANIDCIPVVITLNDMTDSLYFNDIIDLLPVVNSIYISRIPIYSVILGPITNFSILILIISNFRYMHKDAYITLDFVTLSSPSYKYEDTVLNTMFVRKLIKTFFIKYTKLPNDILNNIFKKRFIIDAEEAIKYKIVDMIV